MKHPKMQYTYVGIDSHKNTHTAVFIDCFFEKLGEITFDNLPSKFPAFLKKAEQYKVDGTDFVFGLEDVGMYGRTLAIFLDNNNQKVKHTNALLVARERKNQNIVQKTDSVDGECAARVLLSKFGELQDFVSDEKYFILRSMVARRNFITKNNTSLKNHLHSILTQHYPNYNTFFPDIHSKNSMAFFYEYPSPITLKNVSIEELTEFFRKVSSNRGSNGRSISERAKVIIDTLQDTTVPFQEIRDDSVRSTIRQIESNMDELKRIDKTLAEFMKKFDCTLTSMTGIDLVSAAQILSCIGDVKKFSTPAKLARYSGIAPVSYSSGQRDLQFANQRGNRELNSLFYLLSLRLITTNRGKILNPFFFEYYHRKVSEGKTKTQALKCVQRRLVNIIWTMLTNNDEYVNPPMFDKPPKKEESK